MFQGYSKGQGLAGSFCDGSEDAGTGTEVEDKNDNASPVPTQPGTAA